MTRMTAKSREESTCAVIVTYHPDNGFAQRLRSVAMHFSAVIVVANEFQPDEARQWKDELSKCWLIENERNLGIAQALNQGAKLAREKGFEWIVTLDQDTDILDDMLVTLHRICLQAGTDNVLVGGNYWSESKGRYFLSCPQVEDGFIERKTVITSGMLVPLSLFDRIGYFREDYFIDTVDHEFCLRARAHGTRVLISCCPVMGHSIGEPVKGASRLRRRMSFYHSPARKYYMARNIVATVKAYFFREPSWCLRQAGHLITISLATLLFEPEKRRRIKFILTGLAHGIVGKMGPLEEAWPNAAR